VSAAAPPWAAVAVTRISGSKPARVDPDSQLARNALRAISIGFSKEVVLQREGGSIPVVGMLADQLQGVPLVLLGFSPSDDGAHAPNELMRRWNYDGGLATLAHLWELLSE
jgi:acetylornithine deacetylase/succinyl-diaminopimelate desuccinylase-like protein